MIAKKIPYDTISTTSERSAAFLSNCCFCFSLRTGCFILGYLNLLFNAVHTLALLSLTTYIGVATHGFDHFDPDVNTPTQNFDPLDSDSVNRATQSEDTSILLTQFGLILIVLLCVDFAWVLLNITCLVGLHKKRPGPIRVYVGFAAGRLLLSLSGFIYLTITTRSSLLSVLSHSIDLVLAAYFILVYYVYSIQLEKENQIEKMADNPGNVKEREIHQFAENPEIVAYIYGSKLDKQHLVHV